MSLQNNKLEDQFCSYKISLALKELGFNEECIGTYFPEFKLSDVGMDWNIKNLNDIDDKYCSAPLYQQAIDWFIEKYNLYLSIFPFYNESGDLFWYNIVDTKEEVSCLFESDLKKINNYYKIREQAILKAIEIIKKNK